MRHRVPSRFNWSLQSARVCVCVRARARASCRVSVKYLHIHRNNWNNCSILFCTQDRVCDNDRRRRVTSLTKEKLQNSLKETLTKQNPVLNESMICTVTKFIETLYLVCTVTLVNDWTYCSAAMASSFLRFLDHTQRRTTVGRTSLDV